MGEPVLPRLLSFVLLFVLTHASLAFDHTYPSWGRVLTAQVRDGLVNYAALQAAPAELDACLDEFAAVTEADFQTWSEPQQIAFLLNLYNAATLKLVADHYPVTSIKKIGGLFGSPWKLKVVRLWGDVVTLAEVEHGLLRVRYQEPRIHFAVVCAARGCPLLRTEPFVAERLNDQLHEQGRLFLRDPAKNRVDAVKQTLWLSPLFRWFEADFTRGGKSLAEFVQPFLSEADSQALAKGGFKIKFTDYDWKLNTQ